MSTKIKFLLLAIMINIGSINSQIFDGPASDMAKIKDNINKFSEYYVNGEIDNLTNCYTNDGKIFPNGTPIIAGLEAIKKKWTLPVGVKILRHKIMPAEIKIINDYAYDYGYYAGATQRANGSESAWKGKYVIVWKKVGSDWKIYLDIWNNVNDPQPATATITTAKPSVQDHPEFKAVTAAIEDYVFGLYLTDAKRIIREIRLLGQMNHENILAVLDMDEPADYASFNDVYIVTELMDTDLNKLLRSKHPLLEAQCKYFGYQLLRALLYIHSVNIIHRDIKPANVLVNENCDVKLCTFGGTGGVVSLVNWCVHARASAWTGVFWQLLPECASYLGPRRVADSSRLFLLSALLFPCLAFL